MRYFTTQIKKRNIAQLRAGDAWLVARLDEIFHHPDKKRNIAQLCANKIQVLQRALTDNYLNWSPHKDKQSEIPVRNLRTMIFFCQTVFLFRNRPKESGLK